MAHITINADIYAEARQNIFFSGVVPSLDGQCVSLVKWFLQEMTSVPNPQAARGDARYMGKTLVAQGHATEIPYSQRQRGDIICYEYGVYGHIGVVLSGDRTFEENVNWSGVKSKVISDNTGSWTVYASRIGNLNESWRHDQHIYRIKTYNEGPTMSTPTIETLRIGSVEIGGWDPSSYDGHNDALFTAAAGWKEVNAFIYEQFLAGGSYRELKKKYADFYIQYSPQIPAFEASIEQVRTLTKQLEEANQKLAAYENGDTIIITRKGFNGLFDVIRQFFSKNN